jgi:TRAP-type C4-dicarboxylate transport system permease small subunit
MTLPKINKYIITPLNQLLDIGIVVVILGLVIMLAINVFLRYVVSKPFYWSEEISLFGIVFITFIGGAALVRKKKNIRISILFEIFDNKVTDAIKVVIEFLTLFVIGFVFWQTVLLIPRMAPTVTPTMRISEGLYPIIAGVGYLFMLIFQVNNIISAILGSSNHQTKKMII